jgi:hypothetical protein
MLSGSSVVLTCCQAHGHGLKAPLPTPVKVSSTCPLKEHQLSAATTQQQQQQQHHHQHHHHHHHHHWHLLELRKLSFLSTSLVYA